MCIHLYYICIQYTCVGMYNNIMLLSGYAGGQVVSWKHRILTHSR